VIVTDSEEEQADRFMLPARRRWMALMDMLQFLVSSIVKRPVTVAVARCAL
jgi:hypothetical protein